MKIIPTHLPGVYEIILQPIQDERGYFARIYDDDIFYERGLQTRWVQENQAYSKSAGTIRGFHFQQQPHSETKLVRLLSGEVYDVVLDLRRGSPTFSRWVAIELSVEKQNMLYIPKGCAHAYCTRVDNTTLTYKVDEFYTPKFEAGIRWNDEFLNIPWPVNGEPILSDKDMKLPLFENLETSFVFEGI
jgi:dTDP-4-dehydrorhamnose 3,5-epimerase